MGGEGFAVLASDCSLSGALGGIFPANPSDFEIFNGEVLFSG
jgi:hypothetical protein